MWSRFAIRWCRTMHSTVMWPMNGRYICSRCLREYAVDWPAGLVESTLTWNVGVRAASNEPIRIREVRAAPPAIAPKETLLRRPRNVAPAASQRLEIPPEATGIYVGKLGQRKQLVPVF